MGTINFIITANKDEHVFSKDMFKYMTLAYTSGATGAVTIHFIHGNNSGLKITLTVKKDAIGNVVSDISKKINTPGHSEVKITTQGLYKFVSTIALDT
tara:strand:- start:158 stop:451 length:294 start_codon:yes stop_codon:yes gene_type:complete